MTDPAGERLPFGHASKSTSTAEALARRVRSENLEPGTPLGTKKQLAEYYGIAGPTLNEALRILQSKGIAVLKSGPKGGVFVGPGTERADLSASMVAAQEDPGALLHLFQVQDALEVTTVVEAAIGCDDAHRRLISAARDRLLAAPLESATVTLNWEVDRAVARAGANGYLADAYCAVVDAIEREATRRTLEPAVAERWRSIHVAIADAVMANDVVRAESLAMQHSPQFAVEEGRYPRSNQTY